MEWFSTRSKGLSGKVEDAEWLAVARVLLSVGASGTATCNGRPLYLFVQEQARKKAALRASLVGGEEDAGLQ